jgi:hypothetical protein
MKAEVAFEERDSTNGLTVGFIQAAYCVENWAYYRGERDADGSVLVQRDKALQNRAGRDCAGNTVSKFFFNASRASKPLDGSKLAEVDHEHAPEISHDVYAKNLKTGSTNYLHEVAIETQYCTVLSVRDPNGKFHHQKYVYWGLRWHNIFEATKLSDGTLDFEVSDAPQGKRRAGPVVSVVHDAASIGAMPIDRKFADVLISTTQHQNWNQMSAAATRKADSDCQHYPGWLR